MSRPATVYIASNPRSSGLCPTGLEYSGGVSTSAVHSARSQTGRHAGHRAFAQISARAKCLFRQGPVRGPKILIWLPARQRCRSPRRCAARGALPLITWLRRQYRFVRRVSRPARSRNRPHTRAKIFLITHYPQPSRCGTKPEHTAVSAGLNDGAQQGAISKGAQRGPVCCSLRNRGSVPGGGDALALAIWLCLPGLRRGASQLRQDPGAYQCTACRRQTAVIAGTIFAATKVPLCIWFRAMVPLHSEQGRHLQH